ncbi:MAG: hypothetical protein LBV04_09290 [Deferribacteraceae bacterium]|jgi:hypothetical protein|nr:hypothetical protein [Deferribacteraceae bacterium]
MKKVLFAVSLFMLVFATGCATKIDLVNAPEDAYVYVVYNGMQGVQWEHIDQSDDFLLVDGNDDMVIRKVNAIKPGRYTITWFRQILGGGQYVTLSEKAQARNEELKSTSSLYASFEAKAGEVTYIGDFTFFMDRANRVGVEDNFDAAVEYLMQNYPDLHRDKIVKSLIVLGEAYKKEEAPASEVPADAVSEE